MTGHRAEALRTERLVLTPLTVDDAAEMVDVLSDPSLYEFTGGDPPTLDELTARYGAQVAGPGDGVERWHNWIVRLGAERTAIGYVQATVVGDRADVAWLVGVSWQGLGYAREAAAAMCWWLLASGVTHVSAHVRPGHRASERIAASIGLRATDALDDDGERVWASGRRRR